MSMYGFKMNLDGTIKYNDLVPCTWKPPTVEDLEDFKDSWTGEGKPRLRGLVEKPPHATNKAALDLFKDYVYQQGLKNHKYPRVTIFVKPGLEEDVPKGMIGNVMIDTTRRELDDFIDSDVGSGSETESEDESEDDDFEDPLAPGIQVTAVNIFTGEQVPIPEHLQQSVGSGSETESEDDEFEDYEDYDLGPAEFMKDGIVYMAADAHKYDPAWVMPKTRKRKRVQEPVRYSKRLAKRARRAPERFGF
jgi:hypothetical protein